MDVKWYPEAYQSYTNNLLTIGNFDGLHRGHDLLLSRLSERAEENNARAVVGTFYPHPREVIQGETYPVLTPLEEQLTVLEREYRVDTVLVFPFTKELQQMKPRMFYERLMFPYVKPASVIVGRDHRFGRNKAGDMSLLKTLGSEYNVGVEEVELYTENEAELGSRTIRQALEDGNPEQAAAWLGRPYQAYGEVKAGKGFGRTIGVPTANIALPERKFLPRRGVYVVRAHLGSEDRSYGGVMNVGYNPVVETRTTPAVEVHLLDFGDISLEGTNIRLDILSFIRPEYEEGTITDLKIWIQKDIVFAREYMDIR